MITVTKEWTLFLDRDGVINRRIPGGYVRNFSEFEFLPGVLESMHFLSERFGRICVVTNQQGVGKQQMTEEDLHEIHEKMIKEVELMEGRIDAVYCCTMLENELDNCRKPLPFMAWQAKKDFPEINFAKTIMVGDSDTDIVFGKNIGAVTVMVGEESTLTLPDFRFDNLRSFTGSIRKHNEE